VNLINIWSIVKGSCFAGWRYITVGQLSIARKNMQRLVPYWSALTIFFFVSAYFFHACDVSSI